MRGERRKEKNKKEEEEEEKVTQVVTANSQALIFDRRIGFTTFIIAPVQVSKQVSK